MKFNLTLKSKTAMERIVFAKKNTFWSKNEPKEKTKEKETKKKSL